MSRGRARSRSLMNTKNKQTNNLMCKKFKALWLPWYLGSIVEALTILNFVANTIQPFVCLLDRFCEFVRSKNLSSNRHKLMKSSLRLPAMLRLSRSLIVIPHKFLI